MTKNTQLASLAAIAALSLLSGAARADDGGSPYDNFPVTVADSGIRYETDAPGTCAEVNGNAWFARQLELTDGDVDPAVTATACRTDGDMIAQAETDEDE